MLVPAMRECEHKFLPDSFPSGLPLLEFFCARRMSFRGALFPVQTQQFLKEGRHSVGIITHENSRWAWLSVICKIVRLRA